MTTIKTTCGICGQAIAGAIRDLNQHKAQAHPAERAAMRAQRKARLHRGVSINRCESCGKFVSLEPEHEDNGLDVDEEGNITGSVRLLLNCGECGSELASADSEVEISLDVPHTETCEEASLSLDYELNLEESGGGRFSKHFYYVEVVGTVTCDNCEAEADINGSSEAFAASEFDPS